MAVISGYANDGKRVKFFRLTGNDIVTGWSDLSEDLIIPNDSVQPNGWTWKSGVFANLEDPNRWDLVLATSVGGNPADIIVYKNSVTIPAAPPPPGFGSCHLDGI